jgi:hypothetical protein
MAKSKKKDFQMVIRKIDNDGFNYCFAEYNEFEEIKDKKFHELRKAYVKAKEELELYVYEKAE